jgi:hypothetical protein
MSFACQATLDLREKTGRRIFKRPAFSKPGSKPTEF